MNVVVDGRLGPAEGRGPTGDGASPRSRPTATRGRGPRPACRVSVGCSLGDSPQPVERFPIGGRGVKPRERGGALGRELAKQHVAPARRRRRRGSHSVPHRPSRRRRTGEHHPPEPVEQNVVDHDPAVHDATIVQVGEGAGGAPSPRAARRRFGRFDGAAAEPKRGQGRDVFLVIELDQLDDTGMSCESRSSASRRNRARPSSSCARLTATAFRRHRPRRSPARSFAVPPPSADCRAAHRRLVARSAWLPVPAERASPSNHEGGRKAMEQHETISRAA